MTGYWIINVHTVASLQAYIAGIIMQKKIVDFSSGAATVIPGIGKTADGASLPIMTGPLLTTPPMGTT